MTGSDNPVYVFRVGQIGDALVSLPALYAIKHAIGQAPMVLITDNTASRGLVPAWEVFQLTGLFQDCLSYSPLVFSKLGGLLSLARLTKTIRRRGGKRLFLLIDPGRSPAQIRRHRFFFETVCGLEVIGLNEANSSYHPRDSYGDLLEQLPEYSRLHRIVADYFGTENCGETRFSLPTDENHVKTVDRFWKKVPALSASVPIALGPGSKMLSKRWRGDRFVRLGSQLIANYRVFPVVFGGLEDSALGDRLISAWGNGLNLAGKLSIAEAAVAMSRCGFYIGNDTGTMHLAAVAGLRCICLFSARDNPGRWHPVGEGHQILRARIDCEGCSAMECPHGDPKCMNMISVDQVYAAAENFLKPALNWKSSCRQPGA